MSDERKQAIKDELAKTRLRLRTLLMRLSEEQWNTQVYEDDHGNWKVIEIVRHLTEAEQGLSVNIERIRSGGEGVPENFDLDRWNKSQVKRRAGMGAKELLAEMAKNRALVLELIDIVADDEWDKQGRSPTLEMRTVTELLHWIGGHEAQHTAHIAQALGFEAN